METWRSEKGCDFFGRNVFMFRRIARTRSWTEGIILFADAVFQFPDAESGKEEGFGAGEAAGGGETGGGIGVAAVGVASVFPGAPATSFGFGNGVSG